MARPGAASASCGLLMALLAATFVVSMLWLRRLRQGRMVPLLPLRLGVSSAAVRGVERRWRVLTVEAGRRLLRELGATPSILLPVDDAWQVWAGQGLTVEPRDAGSSGTVTVEFTPSGRPHILLVSDAEKDVLRDRQPPPTPATGPFAGFPPPTPPPGLRELVGGVTIAPEAALAAGTRIRSFPSLQAAAAAARVGPDERGHVDHIVGGSPLHPVFYVVPLPPQSIVPRPGGADPGLATPRVYVREA